MAMALSVAACGGGVPTPEITEQSSDTAVAGAPVTNAPDSNSAAALPVVINSPSTTGFSAQILDDGSVALSWIPLSSADRYDVFDGDQLLTTTTEPQTVVSPTSAGAHDFEIRAVTGEEEAEIIAEGLVVEISQDLVDSAQAESSDAVAQPVGESAEVSSEEPGLGAANPDQPDNTIVENTEEPVSIVVPEPAAANTEAADVSANATASATDNTTNNGSDNTAEPVAAVEENNTVATDATDNAGAETSTADSTADETQTPLAPEQADVADTSASTEVATDAPVESCLLYTSPSPRDQRGSRMPSSA